MTANSTSFAPELQQAQKIDCHVHILDPVRFPYAQDTWYNPVAAETGNVADLGRVLDAHAVQHALIVGPNSGYGLDNRCLLMHWPTARGVIKALPW